MQQYLIGNQFDFPRFLNDMGIPYGNQQAWLSQLTGQPQYVIVGWGARLENMPESFQGFLWGYFKGLADSPAIAMQRQSQAQMQHQAAQSYAMAQCGMMRW